MKSTLEKLQLTINLKGNVFDGNLNFGAVVLELDGKKYPLDITDSEGYQVESSVGVGDYVVFSKFESDYSEVKGMFSNFSQEYSFDLTPDVLFNSKTKALINLHLSDEDKLSNINIGRISNMVITSIEDKSINIPVKQSFRL
ncbi:hypothetical protein [Thalassotalea piscium]|uniref:Transcriptional regulator CtsR n=1 Tax=Thalassotalea piscium TaxID=1230533 RepID=A0A7X0NGM0_9GAMM|nr:hypothetical protein [Thalassotalea piscium]MBB6543100.1 transcriptional regulator CtsR [Thalassotalea piscium]